MRVILLKNLPGIGKTGELVTVQPGYARNFLFPQQSAVPATADQLASLAKQQARHERKQAEVQAATAALIAQLNGKTIRVEARAAKEKLFGSVTAVQLATAVSQQLNLQLSAEAIQLREPLRFVGTHRIVIAVGGQTATLTVEIVAHA